MSTKNMTQVEVDRRDRRTEARHSEAENKLLRDAVKYLRSTANPAPPKSKSALLPRGPRFIDYEGIQKAKIEARKKSEQKVAKKVRKASKRHVSSKVAKKGKKS